jgi:exodeoxyribonuclease V gamma subunit
LQEKPLFLHQSNQLEILFQQMCAIQQVPQGDPLAPEIIVVHNQGMAQWVGQQLAFTTGIAAHLHFPLPARFVWDLFHRISEQAADSDLFAKPVLRWRIAALLPRFLSHPAFGEIAAYLRDDRDGRKRYQLAGRIGDVFDQYQVYRPDLLTKWEGQGNNDHWQALLWRQLIATATPHQSRLPGQFRRILSQEGAPLDLPQRFHLFGINSLAPVYLDLFERVSERTEVHLFHLSPCRHYWGDLVSARQLAGSGKTERQVPASVPDSYYDQGHPLLVSLGRTGQDFFRQLGDFQVQDIDLYQVNEGQHLLATLHNDILDLVDRSAPEQERFVLAPGDRSLQFHRCFSPLREIQVLHDRLLDLFQQYPDLTPGDILVAAPDIGGYAGAIAGVFGEAGQDRRIPWSIADQSQQQEQPVVRCFLELLALLNGRFTAPSVLALCETERLRKRFGLDAAILPRLHTWVRDSGIRWGLDQEHRQQLEVHTAIQHSWQFGLDRLLLGYLMGECDQPYGNLLPYLSLAGSEAGELGGFVTLIETLSRWHRRLQESYTPEDWCGHLLQLLADVFDSDPEDQGLRSIQDAVQALRSDCLLAGYAEKISPAVVNRHLEMALSQPDGGQAFLSGRVTFCNMVPMRSVPFRVLCLLGMNDGDFPRSQHPVAFDLMAREARLGDRNRRNDDRYLFLEALLSARDVFYLSWTGRNQRDDSVTPPSVVVSELQDYLNQSCVAAREGTACAQLTTLHPMQPFSHRCFDGDSAIASYNPAWQPADREEEPCPFLAGPLESPGPEWRLVELHRLVRFWRRPVHFFLQEILGLHLKQEEAGLEENEPFHLDHLQQYQLRQDTVHDLLLGRSPERVLLNLAASGRLPQGGFGQSQFTAIADSGGHFASQLRPLLTTPRPPLEVDCRLGPFHLTGWLTDLYDHGRVTWRSGALKGADLIELWIHHLLLNLLAPTDLPLRSVHAARDSSRNGARLHTLTPVATPEPYLRQLLDLYWQGLSAPLHFFPETSRAWAEAAGSGKEEHQARLVWESGFQHKGEGTDPAYAYFFREADPLDDAFIALTTLFGPIFAHLEADHAAA